MNQEDKTSTTAPLDHELPASRRNWLLTGLWIAPVVVLLLLLVYGLVTRPAEQQDDGPMVGRPLADFTLPDLQGQEIQLTALRGKVVFINIWTTWCQPCIEEMPVIQQLYQRLHPRGLEVLGINMDALGKQAVDPFLRQRHVTFPILLDPKSTSERRYRTTGVPESFIVDKRGILVERIIGPRDWVHPHMLEVFERLLAAPAATTEQRG